MPTYVERDPSGCTPSFAWSIHASSASLASLCARDQKRSDIASALYTGSAGSKIAHVEGIVRSASLCRGFARATFAASRDASRKGPGTVATAKTTVVRLICREEGCRETVHLDFRCIKHQKCPFKDCKLWRHRHKDGLWDHCEKHYRELRCIYKDCDKLCLPNCRYCGYHKCTFEGCLNFRDNEKDVERLFCRDHGCEVTRCYAVAIVVKKGGFGTYCRRHTCRTTDCREHSRTELHKKIKHLEDRLRGRGYESHHYDDLKCRHDKLARDYDSCLLRLNESREEIRILRSTWISEEDNRIWRKDLEDRNARLLLDLEREQRRVEHWERKAGEVLRRVDELEELLAEERLRFPPTDGYERRISELVRKVEILEEELRIERENHTLHEGRRYEVEKLLRTIADLERKLADEHIRSARVDELFKKVEILQAMLAGEREQKDILLEDIAKRDEYDRCYRERYERRRWRRGSFERKRPFPERVERVVERERVYGVGC
ncbi:hypothetical protein CGMCC3_g10313 [Colletotrichum fructicola]|nr:uncharacterized protein CGMCC3_g10313 [Colletotrichum fructicola]KAE9573636.1 hypothetical protein CGMCC3_g10313 [Colletotrichum fructicola]